MSDLLAAVQEFFVGVPLPRSISSTLIILIPKKESLNTFSDFRPICLCNFINKVLTRILCDRLRELLSTLVTEEQSAFLSGRECTDSVLLAQESVQHLDKKL